ncbi:hypothetical protein CRYUN_Cryun12cG0109500 [Craigia yunnanensis]
MDAPQGGSDRDKSSPFSSPVPLVSNFWKEFDLEKEKSVLDEQGLRITENQENSQKNRRKSAESTRDFKKASAEEKLSLFNSLLKVYQEEVDNLTKRAKFGENAFLNIYQKLYEAPDPYPALASIAEQDLKISETESENRKMKIELEEFRTEAMHLKNQQATIRRLEERTRQLEQQELECNRKLHQNSNYNGSNLCKINYGKLKSVSNMQKLHELAQSQMFELRAQSVSYIIFYNTKEDRAAKQSEVNLLMDEGLLCSQLQSAHEKSEDKRSDNVDSDTILKNSLTAKEKIIFELNMELHNIETTLSNEREQHVNKIKKLNSLLNEKVQNLVAVLFIQSMQCVITSSASH